MQAQAHVTFAPVAPVASSGLPVVSILKLSEQKKQKNILKKRREALIAGKGRCYRAIGTHRRSTTKHTWTYGELAELSAVFMEHYNKKPLWKIAEEIHASFAVQLHIQQQEQQRQSQQQATDATDADEEQAVQLREPRTHLPTADAIEHKLMDCVSLNFNDTHNYISKPSQKHQEVWSHLLRAQKHRTMIRVMTTTTTTTAKPEQQQVVQANEEREIWNVHAHEFLYDTDAEYEASLPPAKRRKFNLNPEEVVIGEMDMTDVLEALEEIAAEVETREQARQQQNAAIALSMAVIHQNQQDIEILVGYMEDTQSGMKLCQQRINAEMAKIDAIVQRTNSATTATTTTTASATTTTTTTASATTTTTTTASAAQVGPLTLTANSQFDPNDYRCRECKEMFDPRNGGYWLIGPNHETGDTFYLCCECTHFMDVEETPQTPCTPCTPRTPRAPATPRQRIDEDDSDSDNYSNSDNYSYDSDLDYNDNFYDHDEECS